MGAINVVKTSTQSLGPLVTGILADRGVFGASFILAGGLKVMYDLGILASFLSMEREKEREREAQSEQQRREEA
jgi:hypothetical protein